LNHEDTKDTKGRLSACATWIGATHHGFDLEGDPIVDEQIESVATQHTVSIPHGNRLLSFESNPLASNSIRAARE